MMNAKLTFLSLLLIVSICLVSFSGTFVLADEITNPFSGGDGTVENPYIISTASQLAFLAERTNVGDTAYNAKSYKLANDIDLSSYNTGKGWIPIGSETRDYSFKGNFDGNGKRIIGLYSNDPFDDLITCTGLFGRSCGYIHDVHVINAYVQGNNNTGILVGDANGIIENCSVSGTVRGGNCTGGLVGEALFATIKNCYADAKVSGEYGVGGIAGDLFDSNTVSNCYALGTVRGLEYVGGIAGGFACTGLILFDGEYEATSTIRNCVALNEEVHCSGETFNIARIVGDSRFRRSDYEEILSDNYADYDMDLSGGPLVFEHNMPDGADLRNDAELTASFWTDTMGWDTDIWNITDGKLPALKNMSELIAVSAQAVRIENKIVLTAESARDVPGDSTIYVGIYNYSGMLLDFMKVPVLNGTIPSNHFYVVFKDINYAAYAKVFIWKDNFEPIAEANEISITNYK